MILLQVRIKFKPYRLFRSFTYLNNNFNNVSQDYYNNTKYIEIFGRFILIPESIIHMRIKFAFKGNFEFRKNSKSNNDGNTPKTVTGTL
jgi:hypothetical protein